MSLLGSAKKDVDKDKDDENVTKLESVEFVIVHYNSVMKWLPAHVKSFVYFCSKQTIWTVNKYFTTFFNHDEHS